MKATGLMIGDWVRCTDPKPFRITDIETEWGTPYFCVTGTECLAVDGGDLQPIPLTAEILEENGFEELMNEGEACVSRFGLTPKPTRVWQYGFGWFNSVAYVPERNFLRIKFMEGCTADIDDIKYVHELQHALRLFKVDKEIEL